MLTLTGLPQRLTRRATAISRSLSPGFTVHVTGLLPRNECPFISGTALRIEPEISRSGTSAETIYIRADNQSAIKLLKNPIFSPRSKHIDVIWHFARERVARKEVGFTYTKTDDMVADALTKPVPPTKFYFCRNGMCIN